MQIREDEFKDLIGGYERVLYLCHRNADPDAVGSGFALQEAFGGDLAAVEGVSRTGAALTLLVVKTPAAVASFSE